jgi:Ras-related protein Rab-11A
MEADSKPTVGIEFSSKNLVKEDGKTVRAQFWDTAGSERFQSVTSSYFRGSVAACVIYDIADFKTFKSVAFWLKELKTKCNENIVILLIGNKCDLEGRRQVSKEAAAEYAAKH